MQNVKLDSTLCRTDFTDRECAKIVAGLIGSLCQMTEIDKVKRAIDWWSQNQSAWEAFRKLKAFADEHPEVDLCSSLPFSDHAPVKVPKW